MASCVVKKIEELAGQHPDKKDALMNVLYEHTKDEKYSSKEYKSTVDELTDNLNKTYLEERAKQTQEDANELENC